MTGTRSDFDAVDSLYLPIAAAVMAIVVVAVLVAIVRYRARPGREARPTRDRYVLDAALALITAAIVAVLLATSLPANGRESSTKPTPAFRVDVLAYKWGWRFSYPSLPGVVDQSTAKRWPTLHVPAGRVVALTLRTRDVVHSFWIPDLRFKRDAWPHTVQHFQLRFDRGGADGVGHCAQFCGLGHASMVFFISGLDPPAFAAWAHRARR